MFFGGLIFFFFFLANIYLFGALKNRWVRVLFGT